MEATLVLLDNSSYALNGDYLPTRWQSQVDSASLLIQAKLQANMQSSVALGLMGGSQVQILCTLTNDSNKICSYLFGVKLSGELHFTQVYQILFQALQIGALALKHRANDLQKQRIVCFVCSTIVEDVDTLKIFAKKLKKNSVAVDIIAFGDNSKQQRQKIEEFISTINHQDNSKAMFIEPGCYVSQKLLGTDIFMSGGGGSMGGMGGNVQVDDPQLAEAIRMSLLQSQAATNNQQQGQNGGQRQQTQQQLEQLAIRMSLQEAQRQNLKDQQKKDDKKQ